MSELMTNEEAIAILQNLKPVPYRGDGKSITHMLVTIALNMAIEALKTEPCEDAIDRHALRAQFNHLDEVYEGMSEEEKHEAYIYGQIIRAIDDAPPITLKNQKTMKSVLDEIRAEIENHCGLVKENHCKYCSYCHNVMGVREILEVIDKYKEGDKE